MAPTGSLAFFSFRWGGRLILFDARSEADEEERREDKEGNSRVSERSADRAPPDNTRGQDEQEEQDKEEQGGSRGIDNNSFWLPGAWQVDRKKFGQTSVR